MTDRMTALTERYILLLTIWPTPEHAQRGGMAIRAASGVLSGNGLPVEVGGHVYPAVLDPGVSVTRMFSTEPVSASFTLPVDELMPMMSELDLRSAVGELALVNEVDGVAVEAWNKREIWLRGRVTAYSWGTRREFMSVTLSADPLVDRGDFYPPGAELNADRFPDLDNTGERDRAPQTAGRLPPLVYAPVGSDAKMPLDVVVDEVSADGVTDLVPRRWLLGYREPTSVATQQFWQVDPDASDKILRGLPDETVYQHAVSTDQDDQGETYWYVAGNFIETSTPGAAHWNSSSATVTFASGSRGKLRVGWQAKADTGTDADWCVIQSQDGTQLDLDRGYSGATATNSDSQSIPLSIDQPGGLLWTPGSGGIVGDGGEPITNVVDFIIDLLRMTDLSLDIAWGDLEAFRARLAHVRVTYYRNQRGSPWAKVQELLGWLPIRAYREGQQLRFAWIDDYREADAVHTFDLTTPQSVYRVEPVKWLDVLPSPIVRVRYKYDWWKKLYRSTLTLDGTVTGAIQDYVKNTGRAVEAVQAYKGSDQPADVELEIDTLEYRIGAELAAQWVLDRYGFQRQVIKLEVAGAERWLKLGDLVYVLQPDAVDQRRLWRIEGITLDGVGAGSLMLESVPASVGTLRERRQWGDGIWGDGLWG